MRPAAVACREYDNQVRYAIADLGKAPLGVTHGAAPELSVLSCRGAMAAFKNHWQNAAGMNASQYESFDRAYDPKAAWRSDNFQRFIT
jgi:hypothetical protein